MDIKQCTRCGETKPLKDFTKTQTKKGDTIVRYHISYCKACGKRGKPVRETVGYVNKTFPLRSDQIKFLQTLPNQAQFIRRLIDAQMP